jgi:hypothetical protein
MSDEYSWFGARLLFESPVAGGDSLFEERVLLIKSDGGMPGAEKKAVALGRASDEKYKNPDGEMVKWTFRELLDLVQLNDAEIGEGAEVYYHFLKPEEVEGIRESLKPGSL